MIGNKKKIFIRQGDIMFESVLEGGLTNNIDEKPLDTKTVALGELTGHHHSFRQDDMVLLFKDQEQDTLPSKAIIATSLSTELQHQEHLSIQFPKGEYIIKREQSYNPFLKRIQRSAD